MSNKNLVIVESPAKAKTIEGYLGKDFIVKSSFGHVRDLIKGDKAIDVANNFLPSYEISKDKKDIVKELKKLSKEAEVVWLATDDDREGEAISWHLSEALDLGKKDTRRIVFREITKNAILNAIQTPRSIDIDLVNAQQARRVLDRLVGFELSPILWKKIKRGLSAGRVQSVAVRLVVDREREIDGFEITNFYKVVAEFKVEGNKILQAELSKRLTTEAEAQTFLENCVGQSYSISDLEIKPAEKKPAAPFTTSTLQQEASRKLGFSVTQTMMTAQRLYESGQITYMRTDSVNLSDTAISAAKEAITDAYGSNYVETRKYATKSSTAQEAHEAIRPTEFTRNEIGGDRNEVRLYDLIWKRAIASQMANAKLEKTTVTIEVTNGTLPFKAHGEVVKFDGFLKVYLESSDDEDEDEDSKNMLPPLTVGQQLALNHLKATERFTRPPARYTEASLVKKLEELGIGRPSTYAPTISTIQKREYVHKEPRDGNERHYVELTLKSDKINSVAKTEITGADKGKLNPTDTAMIVNDFLVKSFPNVTNFSFTASIEKEFDDIAQGKMVWDKMIEKFYSEFHLKVESAENIERSEVGTSRVLGFDPASGRTILVRLGKFGAMAQIGDQDELEEDEKPTYASLLKGQRLDTITLEEALELFKLPRSVGEYEGEDVTVAIGRFGPYVKYGTMFVSLEKNEDPMLVDIDRAVVLIKEKEKADAPIAYYDELPVQKGVGRFGPFIKWNSIFINVNKKYDFDNLTSEDVESLIKEKIQKDIDKVLHNWEEEGIVVEKARWGRSVIKKGKQKIELDKKVDAAALTLEDVKALLEKNAPKKKAPAKKKK